MNTLKTVFITGGAKGIGAGCARAFAAAGYKVAINYKTSKDQAEALSNELGAFAFYGDCADENDVKSMISAASQTMGGIGVLVNNAGVSLIRLFSETTKEDWDYVFDNDLKSAFFCSKAVLRGMIERGGGAMINISSMWGITGGSCEVAYSAAKAGMIGLTKALSKELSLSGITVNCVCPGVIDTDMNRNLGADTLRELREQIPLGRLGTPEDVAKAVLFFAEADYVTGQILAADGGMTV